MISPRLLLAGGFAAHLICTAGAFASEGVFFIAGNPSNDLGAQYAVTLS